MSSSLRALLPLMLALLVCGPARAQLPLIRLDRLYPQGGRAGVTVEVGVSGEHFEEVRQLHTDDPGLKAEFVKQEGGRAVFRLAIAPGTLVGTHDVRAVGRHGISNPLLFEVNDSLTEAEEREPNDTLAQANPVPLNSVITGAADSSGDDCFRWKGTKGQRVVIDCLGSRLGNNIDPALALRSPSGRELASNRDFNGLDPLLDFTVPEDGEYTVRVYDFNYTGGGAYRLRITTRPYLDAVFPPAVQPGAPARLTLSGRNLPEEVGGLPMLPLPVPGPPIGGAAWLDFFYHPPATAFAMDGFQYRLATSSGLSNPVSIGHARAPLVEEREPNNSAGQAQALPPSCEVGGRLDTPRDQDWFAAELNQGQTVFLGAYCQRMGYPGDLVIFIRGADGQDLAELDDSGRDYNQRFSGRSRDPDGRFTASRDGTYHFLVTDRYQRGGSRYLYRLRVSSPQPDYRPVVVHNTENSPSALLVRQGGSQHYHLILERQDDFNGEVVYAVEGLPKGVSCPEGSLGPAVTLAPLVFTAEPDAPPAEAEIRVRTWALIDGKRVERDARSVVQAINNQPVSRMARNIVLAVRPSAPFAVTAAPASATVLQGGSLELKVAVRRLWPEFTGAVQLTGLDTPSGFNVAAASVAPGQVEATVTVAVAPNARPGKYTLSLRAEAQVPFTKDPEGKDRKDVRVTDPSTPVLVVVTAK